MKLHKLVALRAVGKRGDLHIQNRIVAILVKIL